jgi:hypothetical protein
MTGGPTVLCVATLNVCGLPWSQSSLPPLAERAVEFGRRLEESGLDVVNLQEVWGRRALAVIRAQLPSFPHVAWRRGVAGQPAGGLVTFSRRPVGAVSYTSFHEALQDAGGVRFRARRAVNSLFGDRKMTPVLRHLLAARGPLWRAHDRAVPAPCRCWATLHRSGRPVRPDLRRHRERRARADFQRRPTDSPGVSAAPC